jgi:UDP-N-acetylmuramoylalanine--D-glutamate ligase
MSAASVLIIGAGRSGIAAAKLALHRGHPVSLFDDQPEEKLRYFLEANLAQKSGLSCVFNQPDFSLDQNFGVVILSPGVPLTHRLVMAAKKQGIPVLNEIEMALNFKPSLKIVGITGTNGKSTATVMMTSVFEQAGLKVRAGGNLGTPLCDLISEDFDYLVLELSSFQLETLSQIKLDVAIILNISPDHLDRYPSMQAYTRAKLAIIDLVRPAGHVVLNQELHQHAKNGHYFSRDQWGQGQWGFLNQVNVKGLHNQENAIAVALAAQALGLKDLAIVDGLNNFKALDYRCQLIAEKNGLTFINDSKGTTVVAVEKALSCAQGPVHLLLGGHAKGECFASLAGFSEVAGFYIYGQSQIKIFEELNDPRALCFRDLPQAFNAAVKFAKPGSTVLLSPGCASYDQFADYAERGRLFNQLVSEY